MGCRIKGMTTDEYRRSFNYRSEYFKKYRGFCGRVWICALCLKPMFGKDGIEIDHVRPLNQGGANNLSNLAALCHNCNSSKSDILDSRMYKIQANRVWIEPIQSTTSVVGTLCGSVVVLLCLIKYLLCKLLRIGRGKKKYRKATIFDVMASYLIKCLASGVKLILVPITRGSLLSRMAFASIYTLLILLYLSECTALI